MTLVKSLYNMFIKERNEAVFCQSCGFPPFSSFTYLDTRKITIYFSLLLVPKLILLLIKCYWGMLFIEGPNLCYQPHLSGQSGQKKIKKES